MVGDPFNGTSSARLRVHLLFPIDSNQSVSYCLKVHPKMRISIDPNQKIIIPCIDGPWRFYCFFTDNTALDYYIKLPKTLRRSIKRGFIRLILNE